MVIGLVLVISVALAQSGPPTFSVSALPNGTIDQSYNETVTIVGGQAPFTIVIEGVPEVSSHLIKGCGEQLVIVILIVVIQMWFAALETPSQNPWFLLFLQRLLENSPEVTALLGSNPFPHKPPLYVRALLYEYRFFEP